MEVTHRVARKRTLTEPRAAMTRAPSAVALASFRRSESEPCRCAAADLGVMEVAAAMPCQGSRSTFARSRAQRAAGPIDPRVGNRRDFDD
jgi:hypothetical protein